MTTAVATARHPGDPHPNVMGILNVTPDSFYADSRADDTESAIAAGREMIRDGASVIDVGGESSRPGAEPVDVDTELARVLPVVEVLARETVVSIDTRHEVVAREAVALGASIVNDISASLEDVAAETGAGWVAMHMQGHPTTMQAAPVYADVVGEVLDYLIAAVDRGRRAGIDQIWIDPGIGFGKTQPHNLELLANIDRFVASGFPVLIGVSRKGMTGRMHAASDSGQPFETVKPVPTDDRLEASVAVATWCALLGVDIVRVHDVVETVQALKVVAAGSTV